MSDFQHAQLDWDENGQPLSRAFGDVYFSRHSGLNETRHVFLATNRLAERFAALGDGEVLCIGETGFGTGLNFLCAWQLFERVAPAGARLEFVSVEKFPLAFKDKVATPEWQARLKEIVPSYGRKLNNDIELTNSTRAWSSERLQLIHVPVQPEA